MQDEDRGSRARVLSMKRRSLCRKRSRNEGPHPKENIRRQMNVVDQIEPRARCLISSISACEGRLYSPRIRTVQARLRLCMDRETGYWEEYPLERYRKWCRAGTGTSLSARAVSWGNSRRTPPSTMLPGFSHCHDVCDRIGSFPIRRVQAFKIRSISVWLP